MKLVQTTNTDITNFTKYCQDQFGF